MQESFHGIQHCTLIDIMTERVDGLSGLSQTRSLIAEKLTYDFL